ncbi:hypothetical protein E4P40_13220 [Blastococcus sp. CT_GayMR20]|uniref:hypothetical protein n=1 Tax=Blastococcus sp. CT_GayMR20 TaxID=2559609 RepID=UPI001073D549|nr:hypothetical protein [Blastococcus sp. CT_GayMR20]TFV86199.1 hypothetical protein E4P40_13055 [Blastococcus sp. CT_GayMR20]TFV86228.1 hypothetical protein E4P40_13220 [Blastococcus sp. CT_GayMR20]
MHNAGRQESDELAAALVDGGTVKTRTKPAKQRAQENLDAATATRDAYEKACAIAHARLVAATSEHRDEWAAVLGERQRDAADRLAAAAAEFTAAGTDVVAASGLLGMLEAEDGRVVARPWAPAAHLSNLAAPLAEAVDVVRAAVALAPDPAEAPADSDDDDDEEVGV